MDLTVRLIKQKQK